MDSIAEQLRKFGMTPSPQRIAVYSLLRNHPAHQTAEEIFRAVRRRIPSISLTTVYNTLRLLVARGAVWELMIEEGVMRYDANRTPHSHFRCIRCGQVYDFAGTSVPQNLQNSGLPEGFEVQKVSLCCHGICPACRRDRLSR